MKFMLMMLGTQKGWEALSAWSPADLKAHIGFMKSLNRELSAAGELVLAEGLDLPMNAKLVTAVKGQPRVVTDGPFPETKELIAGYAILQVRSKEEAIEWVKRMPHPHPGEETEVEIRALYELADLHALHEKK